MKKIAFFTIGCKLNFSETSIISKSFNKKKYKIVDFKDYADIYVINTCAVTHKAEKDLKYIVKKILKKNNNAFIIALGCYSQIEKNKLYNIKGIKLVLGNDKKFNIIDYIERKKKNIYSCELFTLPNEYKDAYSIEKNRTRSFLKIQDGCNYKCSYCTIPLARGLSRSNSIKNIIKNIYKLLKKGIKEIVLTGVNIGDYKYNNKDFLFLIKQIEKIKKLKRIRISSIEPNLLKDNIIKFISKSKKFLNHFHIPLQSGSDYILNKMRRRYLTKLYLNKIKKIISIIPDACIGSDVIVGFPGENNKYFMETYKLIKSIKISYLHIFSFSPRKNTKAFKMKNKIENNIIKYRSKKLREISYLKTRLFYKSFLGTKRKVLFENKKNDWIYGYTDNYIKVKIKGSNKNKNKIINVMLEKIEDNKNIIIGKIKNDKKKKKNNN